ncbi:putative membrane protein [Glaciihabitans tibetensis]|uniref:Putative membrane protein n=2 Tax=Glaciihabitans tibetensis TaxID=1266600 RepID=A0A2T0V4A8_9MICO|nr:putative membrane protein [Glaciihabitans tibetensis]
MQSHDRNVLVKAVETLEDTEAFDSTIASTRAAVGRVLHPGLLRDVLNGRPLGHPAHPIAILVPTGAWISSAVLDFVPGQEKASRTLVGVGLLAVAPAAFAGIADWSLLSQKQQRVGIVHWAANLASVALYTASLVQRRRGKQLSGKVLGMVGLSVVSVSGYLGGHLAYRQAANVTSGEAPAAVGGTRTSAH